MLTDTCASVTVITHSDCHSLVPLLHEASGLFQWRGLTAFSLSRACPYMRTRTSRSHSRAFSLSSSAQSRLSSASRRTPALLSLLLDCCQAAFTGNNVGGCSPDHFPLSFSPRGRSARLSSLPARGRSSSFSSLPTTFSRLSFFSPRAFRLSSRLFRIASLSFLAAAAHITSRGARSLFSPLVACSSEHFSLAYLPRLAAYLRRLCSRVRSFVRVFVRLFAHSALSLLLSLSSAHGFALLVPRSRHCSSRASPSASSLLVPRLQLLLSSCLAFSLFQARHPSSITIRLLWMPNEM